MKKLGYQFMGFVVCLFTLSCQSNNSFEQPLTQDRAENVEFMASMLDNTDFVEAKVFFENEKLEVKVLDFAEEKNPLVQDFALSQDNQKVWKGLSKIEVAENVYDYGKASSCIIAQTKVDANGKYSLAIKNCL